MSNFQAERAALYAKYPKESEAYESEFKELQARLAEAERQLASFAQGVKISIPTDTMEQEFAAHYRRGYEAGKAAATADSADEVQP